MKEKIIQVHTENVWIRKDRNPNFNVQTVRISDILVRISDILAFGTTPQMSEIWIKLVPNRLGTNFVFVNTTTNPFGKCLVFKNKTPNLFGIVFSNTEPVIFRQLENWTTCHQSLLRNLSEMCPLFKSSNPKQSNKLQP